MSIPRESVLTLCSRRKRAGGTCGNWRTTLYWWNIRSSNIWHPQVRYIDGRSIKLTLFFETQTYQMMLHMSHALNIKIMPILSPVYVHIMYIGIYVVPSVDSLRHWHGVIFLRKSHYRKGIFKFVIRIPEEYPDASPRVFFTSKVQWNMCAHMAKVTHKGIWIESVLPCKTSRVLQLCVYIYSTFFCLPSCLTHGARRRTSTRAYIHKAADVQCS